MSQEISEKYVTLTGVADVTIGAVDGRKILLAYGFEFDHNEGPHLSEWGATTEDSPTGEAKATVFEVSDNLTLRKMFGALSRDISAMCLTKSQIGTFLEANQSLLRRESPLFLLFRRNGHFFVAKATRDTVTKLKVLRFEDERGWFGSLKPRLVIPG